jgi:iduronate 2-sulfatase
VDLCGLSGAPANLQGHSLMPLLRNANARWDHPAVSQILRSGREKPVMGYSIRTERHRYSYWNEGAEGEELYDYKDDPRELRNLAKDPAADSLKRTLRAQLDSISRARGMTPGVVPKLDAPAPVRVE